VSGQTPAYSIHIINNGRVTLGVLCDECEGEARRSIGRTPARRPRGRRADRRAHGLATQRAGVSPSAILKRYRVLNRWKRPLDAF
jgi:hypothetical protein